MTRAAWHRFSELPLSSSKTNSATRNHASAAFKIQSDRHRQRTRIHRRTAQAATRAVNVNVTVQSLVPANSISFAPLRLGFKNGTFNAFNLRQVATVPIGWVNGLLTPGSTLSAAINAHSVLNLFLTFAAMAVQSTDFFIRNDAPLKYRLFGRSQQPRNHQHQPKGQRHSGCWL